MTPPSRPVLNGVSTCVRESTLDGTVGRLTNHQEQIAAFCHKWHITELALFGSALPDDFQVDSDIDILVSFAQGATWGMFDLVEMQEELGALLGRQVDLVERSAIEDSENTIRRRHILDSAVPVYVA